MLAIADAQGMVSASLPGLASVANVELPDAIKAIKTLQDPDEYSRTKDHDGRRINPVDGGWHILNYEKYRKMLNAEERREYQAKWAANKRRQTSTARRLKSTESTHAEAEAEAEADEDSSQTLLNSVKLLSLTVTSKFNDWMELRRSMGKAPKNWNRMFAEQAKWLSKYAQPTQLDILSASIRNNWQGLFEPKNGQVKYAKEQTTTKPQPDGWLTWLRATYPNATQKNFWKVPPSIQKEFENATNT